MNIRLALLSAALPLVVLTACATSTRVDLAPMQLETPSSSGLVIAEAGGSDVVWTTTSAPSLALAGHVADTPLTSSTDAGLDLEPLELPYKGDGKIGKSYTQLKLGGFEGSGDLSNQDTGIYGELVFGRELIPFLAIEGVIGYLKSDGPVMDVWAVPLFVQGRVQVPVLIFEPYAGIGLGGAYVDGSSTFANPSGFGWAGNAFLGVEVGIGNLAVGLEAKYIATEEIDNLLTVEGTTVFLSFKIPF